MVAWISRLVMFVAFVMGVWVGSSSSGRQLAPGTYMLNRWKGDGFILNRDIGIHIMVPNARPSQDADYILQVDEDGKWHLTPCV